MPSLKLRAEGSTIELPLVSDRSLAAADGTPTVAVYHNGQKYYAYASKYTGNSLASFVQGGKTWHLLSKSAVLWEISSAGDMLEWRAYMAEHNDWGVNAIVTADFSMEGVDWEPVGTKDNPYTGTFEGDGHTISNLSVSGSREYSGIFGYFNGEAKDLALESATIATTASGSDNDNCYAGGIAGYNLGAISGCYVSGSVSLAMEGSSSAGFNAGGIAGCNYGGSITGCSCSADIASEGSSRSGGIAGRAYYGTITDCHFTGSVAGSYAGGIVGYCAYNTISGCTNSGAVASSGDYAGGIAAVSSYGTISGCENSGEVSGSGSFVRAGGIAGSCSYDTISDCSNSGQASGTRVGGIAGQCASGVFSGCSNTGQASGKYAGGIAGYCEGATLEGCWNAGSAGASSTANPCGGIIGYANDGYSVAVTACCNAAGLSTSGSIGGILGYSACTGENKATVTACYSAGDISGNYAGGIFARESESGSTELAECYWSGSLSASTAVNDSGTEVDGAEVTWASAMEAMNAALTEAGSSWRYEANDGSDKETRPLVPVSA